MSHFTCLVILPKDQQPSSDCEAQKIVDSILAPFDENTSVDPYQTECYCVGCEAKRDARESADAAVGTIQSFRERFHSPFGTKKLWDLTDAENKVLDAAWSEFIKPYNDAEAAALAVHPMYGKPDPTCDECKGTGQRTTAYNPKSKWDWYQIGGRWDGELHPERKNVFPLTELKPGWSAYSIVTPDGQWNAEGEMGWFGMARNEDPAWDKLKYEIASAFPEHYGVLCDLHI